MFNWIRVILNRIKVDKERKAWVKKLKRDRFLRLAKGECCKDRHEPFIRFVDWPDDLIEEYYATITGWGFVFPEDKEENSMKYRVKDEYIDNWYGSQTTDEIEQGQAEGITMDEIKRLAVEWGISVDDLMEQVEEV